MTTNEQSSPYWVHDLSPFLFEFPDFIQNTIGLEGVRFYGFAYVLGFLIGAALLWLAYKKQRSPLDLDAISTLMTALVVGVLVGGRLGFIIFYDLGTLLSDPARIFRVWEGGMSSHGGFIGVAAAVLWFSKRKKMNLWKLGDTVIAVCPPGLFLGRVANFVNGELWGRVTEVPWAVLFPQSPSVFNTVTGIYGPEARHPSQLYGAFLEGIVLTIWLQWRFWMKGGKNVGAGILVGEFLLLYGIFRVFVEFFREPDAELILGLSRGQFYSVPMIVVGTLFIVRARKGLVHKGNPKS